MERTGQENRTNSSSFWLGVVIATIVVLILLGVWGVVNATDWFAKGRLQDSGVIGDYFNGIIGPFIAFSGVITTFAAFLIQYKANQAQSASIQEQQVALQEQQNLMKDQLQASRNANQLREKEVENQENSIKNQQAQLSKQYEQLRIDRFEQRFFEMLRIHRENVASFQIQVESKTARSHVFSGATAFMLVTFEVEAIYLHLKHISCLEFPALGAVADQLHVIAYNLVYWGFRDESHLKHRWDRFGLNPVPQDPKLVDHLLSLKWMLAEESTLSQAINVLSFDKEMNRKHEVSGERSKIWEGILRVIEQFYFPLEEFIFCKGYADSFGQYFRHLFQIYSMLVQFDKEHGGTVDTYHYAKLARAQISDFEQKLICYDLSTELGSAWWKDELILKYKPLKNVPIDEIPVDFSPIPRVRELLKKQGIEPTDEVLKQYFDVYDPAQN